MKKTLEVLGWLLDYMVIPAGIIYIAYQHGILNGFIDHLESGKELASVNEIFRGKIPYKDIYILFGPLNTYLEAFSMILFGKSLAVLRGYFLFGNVVTLIIGYLIARAIIRNRLLACLTALILMAETYHPFWSTRWGGLRFGFGLLSILMAVMFFKKRKDIWILLSGMTVAISLMTTTDIGIYAFIAIAAALLCSRENLKGAVIFGAGFGCVFALFLSYFLISGALVPYLNTIFIQATTHITAWQQPRADLSLWQSMAPDKILSLSFKCNILILFYLFLALFLAWRFFKKRQAVDFVDYSLLCISIYGLLIYKTSFRAAIGPQFQMALQPAIILVFVLLGRLSAQKRLISKIAVFACVLFYIIFSEKIFYENFKKWLLYQEVKGGLLPMYSTAIPLSRVQLAKLNIDRGGGIVIPADQAIEIESVTKYITSVTRPDEAVFTFPEQGMYNFFANRPCLDRFNISGVVWATPAWRKELMDDLKNIRPRHIIYRSSLSNLARSIGRSEELLPDVKAYIDLNYVREASFGSVDILKLRD